MMMCSGPVCTPASFVLQYASALTLVHQLTTTPPFAEKSACDSTLYGSTLGIIITSWVLVVFLALIQALSSIFLERKGIQSQNRTWAPGAAAAAAQPPAAGAAASRTPRAAVREVTAYAGERSLLRDVPAPPPGGGLGGGAGGVAASGAAVGAAAAAGAAAVYAHQPPVSAQPQAQYTQPAQQMAYAQPQQQQHIAAAAAPQQQQQMPRPAQPATATAAPSSSLTYIHPDVDIPAKARVPAGQPSQPPQGVPAGGVAAPGFVSRPAAGAAPASYAGPGGQAAAAAAAAAPPHGAYAAPPAPQQLPQPQAPGVPAHAYPSPLLQAGQAAQFGPMGAPQGRPSTYGGAVGIDDSEAAAAVAAGGFGGLHAPTRQPLQGDAGATQLQYATPQLQPAGTGYGAPPPQLGAAAAAPGYVARRSPAAAAAPPPAAAYGPQAYAPQPLTRSPAYGGAPAPTGRSPAAAAAGVPSPALASAALLPRPFLPAAMPFASSSAAAGAPRGSAIPSYAGMSGVGDPGFLTRSELAAIEGSMPQETPQLQPVGPYVPQHQQPQQQAYPHGQPAGAAAAAPSVGYGMPILLPTSMVQPQPPKPAPAAAGRSPAAGGGYAYGPQGVPPGQPAQPSTRSPARGYGR